MISRARAARLWLRDRWLETLLLAGFLGLVAWLGTMAAPFARQVLPEEWQGAGLFKGDAAYRHVTAQMQFGPRPAGSEANRRTAEYIARTLSETGWAVELQGFTYQGVAARNIIGRAGQGPVALIGAHYDTRRVADRDPDPRRRGDPVPGANDGASGVAVLLELARTLDKDRLANEVWLVFFDAEDNGRLGNWEYAAGSSYMARTLSVRPQMVIIADMIGDADQQIFKERTSTPGLVERVWATAASLGYSAYFVAEHKWSIIDDHTAFLERGIPAVDIIDFDYAYYHTTQDTADKVAPQSLERVGRVLEALLEGK